MWKYFLVVCCDVLYNRKSVISKCWSNFLSNLCWLPLFGGSFMPKDFLQNPKCDNCWFFTFSHLLSLKLMNLEAKIFFVTQLWWAAINNHPSYFSFPVLLWSYLDSDLLIWVQCLCSGDKLRLDPFFCQKYLISNFWSHKNKNFKK